MSCTITTLIDLTKKASSKQILPVIAEINQSTDWYLPAIESKQILESPSKFTLLQLSKIANWATHWIAAALAMRGEPR